MIHLRNFKYEDAPDIAKHANNPRVAQYLPEVFPSPYTLEAAQWWVSEGHAFGRAFNQAIVVDGECVGSIGASFLEGEYRYTARLGYWLGEAYWGKGVMTRAVVEFTNSVSQQFEMKRLFAPVVNSNNGSIRVLEKAGFACEGVLKNNVFLRGVFYDEYLYATYPDHSDKDESNR